MNLMPVYRTTCTKLLVITPFRFHPGGHIFIWEMCFLVRCIFYHKENLDTNHTIQNHYTQIYTFETLLIYTEISYHKYQFIIVINF